MSGRGSRSGIRAAEVAAAAARRQRVQERRRHRHCRRFIVVATVVGGALGQRMGCVVSRESQVDKLLLKVNIMTRLFATHIALI